MCDSSMQSVATQRFHLLIGGESGDFCVGVTGLRRGSFVPRGEEKLLLEAGWTRVRSVDGGVFFATDDLVGARNRC
jgi:hypothetical protein